MRAASAPGVFGLDIGLVASLLRVPLFANVLTCALSRLLLEGAAPPLLSTLLTALPKDRAPSVLASRYRPISVSSVWYRILMRVFVRRLEPVARHCVAHN